MKEPLIDFQLYGCKVAETRVSSDGRIDLRVWATKDIEADLLAAGLKLRGFSTQQLLAFRNVLRAPAARARLERMLREEEDIRKGEVT